MATKHTRLMRRGAVYYFRCKIPADLVDHYGKKEILESLRTRDATEALRLGCEAVPGRHRLHRGHRSR